VDDRAEHSGRVSLRMKNRPPFVLPQIQAEGLIFGRIDENADPPVIKAHVGAHGLRARKRTSSLLKNLEMESFRVLGGRRWNGAVELVLIS
jgi:hypothetical protein